MTPDSTTAGIRRILQALMSPGDIVVTLCLIVFVWFRALPIEPFDSFESIHRTTAHFVKASNGSASVDGFVTALSQRHVPVYHHILAFVSSNVDGRSAGVSAFSGRSLSLFFAALSVLTLHSFWKRYRNRCGVIRFEDRRTFDLSVSPILFLLLVAAAPAVAVVLTSDMAYLLCAVTVLCSQCRHLLSEIKDRVFVIRETIISSVGLIGAYLIEGWFGFLSLALSPVLLFALLQRQKSRHDDQMSDKKESVGIQKSLASQCLLSLVVCASLSYISPHTTAQSSFATLSHSVSQTAATPTFLINPVTSFFSILFMFGILGSWILSCYCIDAAMLNQQSAESSAMINRPPRSDTSRLRAPWLFLLFTAWSLCFIALSESLFLLFSMIPLLALWAASLHEVDSVPLVFRNRRWLTLLARVLAFFMPAVLLLFASLLLINLSGLFRFFTDSPVVLGYVDAFWERRWTFGLAFAGAGVLCLLSSLLLSHWISVGLRRGRRSRVMSASTVRVMVLLNAFSSVVVLLFVVAEAEDVLTVSLQQSLEKAKLYLDPQESLGVLGLNAPNVHTAFGGSVGLRRDATEEMLISGQYNVILTPVWNIGLCKKHRYDIAAGSAFYRLCLRSYRRALEGPKN